VKGFYDDVEKVSAKERKMMNEAPYDEKQYMKDLNVSELTGRKKATPPWSAPVFALPSM
jgi:hypothetical protein